MRIALTYNEKRGTSPGPDAADAEFDSRDAIASIAPLVTGLGHQVAPIDVSGSIPRLVGELARAAPDLVLNFAEGERGAFREAFYPALFEQLGLAHTGSSASTLAVCLDKALAKCVVAGARVRVPRGRLIRAQGDPWLARTGLAQVPLPAIVKPNLEGSSKGITAASIARDRAQLSGIVADALARYPDGVVVEQLVAGIDVSVGWFAGLGLLPPIGYRHGAEIYDFALKHLTPERVELEIPPPLAPPVARRLELVATRAFAALGVTGYGRVDVRITPDGDVVFLEMNPLPSLTLATGHDELYVAASRLGHAPGAVLAAVLDAAQPRVRRCARRGAYRGRGCGSSAP
jgi:D-alanine-D-alanine ligase